MMDPVGPRGGPTEKEPTDMQITFERVPATEGHGRYEYQAVVPFVGGVVVRQEATTHAYPRGAANPMWFVYVDGVRRARYQTLALAQSAVRGL